GRTQLLPKAVVPAKAEMTILSAAIGSSSERDGEQRVDLPAVEHDDLLREFPAGAGALDPVDIAPGREQYHAAVLHRAHDQKIGGDVEGAAVFALNADTGDQMPIPLRLVDVGVAQSADPVAQHVLRRRIDQPKRQPSLVILRRGYAVMTILGKEVGPALQRVTVETGGVIGVKRFQFKPPRNLGEIHRR